MARVSADLLARCVDDVSAGRRTVAECVAEHPAVADDLRSLLEAVQSIAPPPDVEPEAAFRARGRAAFRSAMPRTNGYRSPNEIPPHNRVTTPPVWRSLGTTLDAARRRWALAPRLRAVALGVLIVAVLLVVGGGIVFAAQEAIPGDPLYPIKLEVENVEVALAPDATAKAEVYLDLAARRLGEVRLAEQRGRAADADAAATGLAQDVQLAERYRRAAVPGTDERALAARFVAVLGSVQASLRAGGTGASPDPALARALDAVDREIAVVGGSEPVQAPGPAATPAPLVTPVASSPSVPTTVTAATPAPAAETPAPTSSASTPVATSAPSPVATPPPGTSPTSAAIAPTSAETTPGPGGQATSLEVPTVGATVGPLLPSSPMPSPTHDVAPIPTLPPVLPTVAPAVPTTAPPVPTVPPLPTLVPPVPTTVPLPTLLPPVPTPVKLPTPIPPLPTSVPLPTLLVPQPTAVPPLSTVVPPLPTAVPPLSTAVPPPPTSIPVPTLPAVPTLPPVPTVPPVATPLPLPTVPALPTKIPLSVHSGASP